MSNARHHVSDDLLISYAAGSLPPHFALVVASHLSLCDDCAARMGAHCAVGGALLSQSAPHRVSADFKSRVMDQLDAPHPPTPLPPRSSGIFPAPLMQALGGMPPKWRRMGMGTRQSILDHSAQGSVRLLYIPAGQAVPDHSHGGLELTLVLQGAFRDETGRYGTGDLEIADASLDHTPIAEDGQACICLAATDAPLRFRSRAVRLLQPFFRI